MHERKGSDRTVLRLATHADAATIHSLRESLALWQRAKGITQWEPGDIPASAFERQVVLGEWWVLDAEETVAAAVRVVYDDPGIWAAGDGAHAGYIHGLMVARAHAGDGLGAQVLQAAEDIVRGNGREIARLDCVASNQVLRRYYEARGYILVAERSFPPDSCWHPVALFEKRLEAQR